MKIKLKSLLSLVLPEICAGCGEPVEPGRTSPFCRRCQVEWEREKSLCRSEHYGRPTAGYELPDAKSLESPDPEHYGGVLHALRYRPEHPDSVSSRLIFKLKHDATETVVDFVAAELAGILTEEAPLLLDGKIRREDILVTWIPRRPEAIIHDGYDHMARCARALARRLDARSEPLLERSRGALEQKRLSARERLSNASETLTLASGHDLAGKTVVLIDDLVTTGASMKVGATLLVSGGTRLVIPVSIAATGRGE